MADLARLSSPSYALEPSAVSVIATAATYPEQVRALVLVTDADYRSASAFLKDIKTVRDEIAAIFEPDLQRYRWLLKEKREAEAPLEDAERILKQHLLAYREQQERDRRQREQAAQAAAQREAETRRLQEAADLELEACATDDPSLLMEADALLTSPVLAPIVTLPVATPKVSGLSYRDNWKVHPTIDLPALIAAVDAGNVPVSFLLPNIPALNQFARATKGTHAVPGVQFVNEKIVATGR